MAPTIAELASAAPVRTAMPAAEVPEISRSIELRAEARRCWLQWTQTRREAEAVGQEAMRLVTARRQEQALARGRPQGQAAAPFVPPPVPAVTSRAASAPAGEAPPAPSLPPSFPPAAADAGTPASVEQQIKVILAANAAAAAATTAAAEMIASLLSLAASDLEMMAVPAAAALQAARVIPFAAEGEHALLMSSAWAALVVASEDLAPSPAPSRP